VRLCSALPRTIEHLQALLAIGRTATYRHVAKGISLGLLERESPVRDSPALIIATGKASSGRALGSTR
jgi:hypothetical protein